METLSENKTIINVPLTTTPKEVRLPPGVSAEACMIVCTLNNVPVAWRKQDAETGVLSILYPASHVSKRFRANEGAVLFWAKTVTGTGTLEVEVLS